MVAKYVIDENTLSDVCDCIRLKQDGTSAAIQTSDIASKVLGTGYTNIPSYCHTEAMNVAQKIKTVKDSGHDVLVFGAISDNHVEVGGTHEQNCKTGIRHAGFALETIGNLTNADFLVNLGDIVNITTLDSTDSEAEIAYFNKAVFSAAQSRPFFRLVGNHDTSNSLDKVWNYISQYNTFDATGATPKRGYGYKDFTSKKVRVIFINTCDYYNSNGGYGMSYEQKKFIAQALDLSAKSDYAQWQILLLSHIPLDYNVISGYESNGDYNIRTDIKAILDAYVAGTSVTINVNSSYASQQNDTVTSNFTVNYSGKNAPPIIANIAGHLHMMRKSNMADSDINVILTPSTGFYVSYNSKYGYTSTDNLLHAKVANTAEDTAVTWYAIDLTDRMIYQYVYGAGHDEAISYSNIVYTVTNNLANCTTNNSMQSVTGSASYNAVITLDEDCTLDSCTVTMGGVNITSSCVSVSGSSVTVSIPEVTGNVAITVLASFEQYSYTVSDVDAVERMDWNGTTAITPASSNSDMILGVSTYNAMVFTDRSGNDFYAMPIPSKATKVTVTVNDSSAPTLSYSYRICNESGGTLTQVSTSGRITANTFSFAKGSGSYICIAIRRSDGTSWAWGYDSANITVVFSNY